MANGGLLRHKAGSAAVAVRRAGAIHTLDSLLHFLLINGMTIAGLPAIGIGQKEGDIMNDKEGIGWAIEAGKNMAWLLAMMNK